MPNLHPMVVHFPIALIFVILACDIIGHVTQRQSFITAGSIVTVLAMLGALAALISGLIAEETVQHTGAAHNLLETHELLGYVYTGTLAAMAIFRFAIGKRLYGNLGYIAVLLSLIAAGVVSYGGYLGGEMVYTHGVGVKAVQQSVGGEATPHSHDDEDSGYRH
jgi:uncharacterized membrane protein